MYKKTHDNHDFLHRVASHSTKGSRRGVVDILPPEAEAEVMYASLKQQVDAVLEQRRQLHARIEGLAAIGRTAGLPPYERTRIAQEKKATTKKLSELAERSRPLCAEVVRLGLQNWNCVFIRVAKDMMTENQFRAAIAATNEILGRPAKEIKDPYASKGDGDRTRERRNENKRAKRKRDISDALADRFPINPRHSS